MTEWKAFKSPDFAALKSALKQPVDLRRPQPVRPRDSEQGFEYFAIGR